MLIFVVRSKTIVLRKNKQSCSKNNRFFCVFLLSSSFLFPLFFIGAIFFSSTPQRRQRLHSFITGVVFSLEQQSSSSSGAAAIRVTFLCDLPGTLSNRHSSLFLGHLPAQQPIVLASYRRRVNGSSSSHIFGGHFETVCFCIDAKSTPFYAILRQTTPSYNKARYATSRQNYAISRRGSLCHATPKSRQFTTRLVTPRHAKLRHFTTRHATPRHASLR